tara:strand:+ start:448 stop:672 length:225 start_codon:yes stop_codon:yes gene_type:complete
MNNNIYHIKNLDIKRYMLNTFFIIFIIYYALIFSLLLPLFIDINKGKKISISSNELGSIVGVLILFIIAVISSY